jgi:hypothetical protein
MTYAGHLVNGCTRCGVLLCAAISSCGDAGELSPFASGPQQAGTGGGTSTIVETSSGDDDGTAGDEVLWDGQIRVVYVRCPRTTQSVELTLDIEKDGAIESASRTMSYADVYDRLPNAFRLRGGWVAPCDLVLRQPDGSEEVIYDCTSTSSEGNACAALEPAVSHDARRIAFTVYRGTITHPEMQAGPTLVDPEADGGESRFFTLPNPQLQATESALHIYDVERGELTELAHTPGVFDSAPAFLSTGRIAFVSTRAGQASTHVRDLGDPWRPRLLAPTAAQLHTMAPTGRDVVRLAPHTMTGDAYPFQLVDGRIAHGSWQAFGMLPFRYDNGAIGTPGATGLFHVYAVGPWGTRLQPLFGQHTHITDGATFTHVSSHRMTQSSDGRLWVDDAAGPAGGLIYGFVPPEIEIEGPGPADVETRGDAFRPADLVELAPWVGNGTGMAGPTPEPAVMLPGYDDPLLLRGFLRDPAALPGNALLVSWTKGGCHDVGFRFEEIFGDEQPPFTSGSDAFVAMNILELVGADTPGCDAGIYRVDTIPVAHPSALALVVDTTEFHELMPQALVPYEAIHGVAAPASPVPPAAELDAGAPFGEVASASMLLRETRAADGHPFGGLGQWTRQGTDTVDYDDDEICGVRFLAVQPNDDDEAGLHAPAGHRVLVLGELPVRNEGATDPLGMPDTSFRARVPADVPFLVQAIDCEGRTLSTSQAPMSVRPGEQLTCGGCHQRSSPGLEFVDVAAAQLDYVVPGLGEGTVPLLGADAIEGWGVDYEFARDVLPIFESRCVPCHSGTDPAAGLPLDEPGLEAGSTWWRLVADTQQLFVPADRIAPNPTHEGFNLRTPQLTRYVRFMNARGSLLYWKAANARTDGRTDAQFADDAEDGFADVDFGDEHPTEITAEELGVLARWIDTGAGAGEVFRADTTAPTLSVAVAGEVASQRSLRIGTVDVGSGIDAASLEACRVGEAGACTAIDMPPAADAGVVEVALPEIEDEVELRVSVLDRAGNRSEVVRTVEALRGTFGQGAPSGDASESSGSSSSDTDEVGGDGAGGCGCRSGAGSSLVLWLLLALTRRRPIDRGRVVTRRA